MGQRLDRLLSGKEEVNSRREAQRWIKTGCVKVNAEPVTSPSRVVRVGDRIEVRIPPPRSMDLEPETGNLEILHEDSDVLVLNKPPGIVVHPSAGHPSGTLVNFLLHHCGDLSGIGGVTRPGIVHRLDKDTSGVMVVAKNDHAHQYLAAQFKVHTVRRQYSTLVWGTPETRKGTVNAPLGRHPVKRKEIAIIPGGRHAVTHWRTLRLFNQMTLLSCLLETGRTHQVRVHLSSIGHPIVGDPLYGRSPQHRLNKLSMEFRQALRHFRGQALHAECLGFTHPRSGKEMVFQAGVPEDFQFLLDLLTADNP